MDSIRRPALLLALCMTSALVALAQSSSSNPSQDPSPAPPQAPGQSSSASPTQGENQGQLSVQARIRVRREKRRADAIRDVYTHLYETYTGMGYLRFVPGPNLQRVTYYAWDTAFTRYYSERLGITLDGRGYYGTPYVGLNFSSITRPAVSTYTAMGGPTYRFYMQPKYSISGRVMGGYAQGNFSGDTNGFGGKTLGLWPDGGTYAVSGGLIGELNVSPALSLRLGGEYLGTGFGSTMQNSAGFTGGFVFRFGRQ